MKKRVKELETILTKAVDKALGVDVSDYVEVDEIAASICPDLASVICTVEIDGQDFELDFSKIGDAEYKLIIICGACNDVVGANKELMEYEESEIGEVLYPDTEIEADGDSLLLTAEFNAENEGRAIETLADILSYLTDEEKARPLNNLLNYFN